MSHPAGACVPADAVLIGYYGRGNLGDDLLMIVAAKIARSLIPRGRLAVRTSSHAPYIPQLLGDEVRQIPFGTRDHHRLIVHGGGGNFFDFAEHSLAKRLRNAMLLAAGSNTAVRVDAAVRTIVNRRRMSADVRIGLGMGIGTYSRGSPALLDALPILADFDALWVRDGGSIANLSALGAAPFVVRGSDLAFLWDAWCPSELEMSKPPRGKRQKLGVILRDWPPGSGQEFARTIAEALRKLEERFDLTLMSFDPSTDVGTLQRLSALKTVQWLPEHCRLPEFLSAISAQDVLLTSRAHGAICGACLGRASVILEIEPKLRAIHGLLPNSTVLAEPPFDAARLGLLIDEALAIDGDRIAADAISNRAASQRALDQVRQKVSL